MIKNTLLLLLLGTWICAEQMKITPINSHSAIWIHVGNIYTTTSFAHLHIPIRTEDLKLRQQFMKSIDQRFQVVNVPKNWPKDKRANAQARLSDLKRFVHATTEDTVERIEEAIRDTHPNSTHHRRKRQLIAIGVGIAAGVVTGVIASEFSADTVDKVVQESQDVISKTVEENIIRIHNQEKDIKQLNNTIAVLINEFEEDFNRERRNEFETSILRATFATLINAMEINKKTRAVRRATHGELDPESFSRRKLVNALEELNSLAVSKGFEAITQDTDALTQFPSSYVIDSRTETIHLITHLPLYRPGEKMKLHKYLNVPIAFLNSTSKDTPIHLEISPSSQFLAISNDGTTYLELHEDEVDTCQIQDGDYFCPILGKFKKQRRSCITALHRNDPEEIQELCPLTIVRPESRMERLNKETWLLMEPEETQLLVTCNEEDKRTTIKGAYILSLPEGCIANTDSMTIVAPRYEAEVIVDGTIVQSKASPHQWIEEGEEPQFKETAMELLQRVGQKAKLNEISALMRFKQKMHALHTPTWKFSIPNIFTHGIFPSLTTILFIAVLCYLAIKFILPFVNKWRQGNNRKQTRHHTQSAHHPTRTESISLQDPIGWDE